MTDPERAALEKELAEVEEKISSAYWAFTRQKRGKPVPGELYVQRNELKKRLREKRCSTSGSSGKSA